MNSAYVYMPLANGLFTLVDLIDYDLAEQCPYGHWVGGSTYQVYSPALIKGTRKIGLAVSRGTPIQLCRLIMERILSRTLAEKELVYHINKNGLDNRRSNLRLVAARESRQNMKPRKHNKSGYKGVSFRKDKKEKPWQTQIYTNGGVKHLGFYKTPEEAYEVYKQAVLDLFK